MGTLCAVLGGRIDKRLRGSARTGGGPGRRLPGRPGMWAAGAAAVLVVGGLATWLLWPGTERPDPRSRVYTEASACLLTPAAGIVDEAVVPVWAGMQQASAQTSGKVSYLEVDGPQTGDNASTFLASLVQGDCDLVLAAGAAPAEAVVRFAGQFPRTRFVVVDAEQERELANVVRVGETDAVAITTRVRDLVAEALRSAAEG